MRFQQARAIRHPQRARALGEWVELGADGRPLRPRTGHRPGCRPNRLPRRTTEAAPLRDPFQEATPVSPLEPAPALAGGGLWGPLAPMGPHIRLQAAKGHRAAVIELKPGLYVVAEIPEAQARSEFGAAAILAPLVIKAATQALANGQDGQGGGVIQAAQHLLHGGGHAHPAAAPQYPALPAPQYPALPAPQYPALPAPHYPAPPTPAAELGRWCDADTLSGVFGCACPSCGGPRR